MNTYLDSIANAGYIYGKAHHIHFEIIGDEANVQALMGRSGGPLTRERVRPACGWGDAHVVVPVGTPLYTWDPRQCG